MLVQTSQMDGMLMENFLYLMKRKKKRKKQSISVVIKCHANTMKRHEINVQLIERKNGVFSTNLFHFFLGNSYSFIVLFENKKELLKFFFVLFGLCLFHIIWRLKRRTQIATNKRFFGFLFWVSVTHRQLFLVSLLFVSYRSKFNQTNYGKC